MLMSAFIKKDSLLTKRQSEPNADTPNVKVATLSMLNQNSSRLRILCGLPSLIPTHDRPYTSIRTATPRRSRG